MRQIILLILAPIFCTNSLFSQIKKENIDSLIIAKTDSLLKSDSFNSDLKDQVIAALKENEEEKFNQSREWFYKSVNEVSFQKNVLELKQFSGLEFIDLYNDLDYNASAFNPPLNKIRTSFLGIRKSFNKWFLILTNTSSPYLIRSNEFMDLYNLVEIIEAGFQPLLTNGNCDRIVICKDIKQAIRNENQNINNLFNLIKQIQ